MILHLTQDLMMTSVASRAARDCGQPFKFVASVTRVIDMIRENDVRLLVVDLQSPDLRWEDLERELSALELELRPPTVAYAQHVLTEVLKQANDSPVVERVMTRGQFHQAAADVFASVLTRQDG